MRKHNFVVGYDGEKQCIYGGKVYSVSGALDLLTYPQAKKEAKELVSYSGKSKISRGKIFKLVEVK